MLSTKDKQQIAEIIVSVLSAKKQVPTTKREQVKEKSTVPEHSKSDIPTILKKMSLKEIKNTFGDMTQNPKESPYLCNGITQFFKDYNIQLTDKRDRISLTYEHKHLILNRLLKDAPQKKKDAVKKNCIAHLKQKIKAIPEIDRWGNEMTDKKREHIEYNLNKEIQRWENATENTATD